MSDHRGELFPTPPEHPKAAEVEKELRRVQVLAQRWVWEIFRTGALSAIVVSSIDGTTVRALIHDGLLEFDAFVGHAPFEASTLAALLIHNHSRAYKARATRPEGEWIPVYVTARYSASEQCRLVAHLWGAFEEAFMWRSELNRLQERVARTHRESDVSQAQA